MTLFRNGKRPRDPLSQTDRSNRLEDAADSSSNSSSDSSRKRRKSSPNRPSFWSGVGQYIASVVAPRSPFGESFSFRARPIYSVMPLQLPALDSPLPSVAVDRETWPKSPTTLSAPSRLPPLLSTHDKLLPPSLPPSLRLPRSHRAPHQHRPSVRMLLRRPCPARPSTNGMSWTPKPLGNLLRPNRLERVYEEVAIGRRNRSESTKSAHSAPLRGMWN